MSFRGKVLILILVWVLFFSYAGHELNVGKWHGQQAFIWFLILAGSTFALIDRWMPDDSDKQGGGKAGPEGPNPA
jgi:hypothetical protein